MFKFVSYIRIIYSLHALECIYKSFQKIFTQFRFIISFHQDFIQSVAINKHCRYVNAQRPLCSTNQNEMLDIVIYMNVLQILKNKNNRICPITVTVTKFRNFQKANTYFFLPNRMSALKKHKWSWNGICSTINATQDTCK